MTSDAKIGLLLGLVFIFIIAFVINGLPGLHNKDDGNKLTSNMVGLNNQTGLGVNERRLALETTTPEPEQSVENIPPSPEQTLSSSDTRFSMALPEESSATTEATAGVSSVTEPAAVAPALPTESIVRAQPAVKAETTQQATTKIYVVQDGDTLGSIAKKVYGEQQGNKLATINALYEANRKTLASPDSLQVGQKLTIPSPAGEKTAAPTPANVLPGRDFTKAESVGQRRLTAGADKPTPVAKKDSVTTGKIYVVKEGDSLWRIAATQLGDGNRYKEIVKLNSDKLTSEDDIQVDMQLKLPAK